MASLLGKLITGIGGTALGIPPGISAAGGDQLYKGLRKIQSFVKKTIAKKRTKAEQKLAEQQKKLAVLASFEGAGTANTGTDYQSTPAQLAALGPQPSEVRTAVAVPEPIPIGSKYGDETETTNDKKMMTMEWVKKNWYYLAGGAAVLYFLMGRKKRR